MHRLLPPNDDDGGDCVDGVQELCIVSDGAGGEAYL